jgi:dTDP-4-dehydrorhamnose 3,5-epimerase
MSAFEAVEADGPRFEDARGWLQVLHESERCVLKRSFSKAGVFRGLHAQMNPSPQTKVIRVVEGRILDIVADLRRADRPLETRELSPADGWVRIAAHYAHGFLALEDTLFEYMCDGRYDEASEEAFSIAGELAAMGHDAPILSAKDRAAPPLHGAAA